MGSQLEFVFKHVMELPHDSLFLQLYIICSYGSRRNAPELSSRSEHFEPIAASCAQKKLTTDLLSTSINIVGIA